MPANVAIGIDIGANTIKVAQVRRTKEGCSLEALGIIPLGEVASAPEGKRKNAKLGLLLRDLLRDLNVRGRFGTTTLPGKRIFFRYVHVPPVPAWRLKALMEYEIEEENTETPGAVAYDYRLLDLPTKAAEFTVLIALAKNEVADSVVEILRESGFRAEEIYPSTTAVFNTFRCNYYSEEDNSTSILLDIGAENVDMVIQNLGRLYFARSLTNAGNSFTDALKEEFNLPFTEAESLKVERGKMLPADAEYDEKNRTYEVRISEALSGAADALANAVQSSLMFCRAQLKMSTLKVEKIYLCGGGARIPGLGEYLGQRLRMKVESLDPVARIDRSGLSTADQRCLKEQPGEFVTAIGLALGKLGVPGTIGLSLLTDKEKKRRNFHFTDKYLYYAAVCFLAGLGLSLYTSRVMSDEMSLKKTKYQQLQKTAEEEQKKLDSTLGKMDRLMSKVDALQLRANSAKEIFDILTVLTDSDIVPHQINITQIKVMPIQPVAFYDNSRAEPLSTPTERTLQVGGLVRTAIPPTIDPEKEKKGIKPEPPRENYKEGLEIIRKFNERLQAQDELVYRATLAKVNSDPDREKKGDPLVFEITIELKPRTVQGRQLMQQFAAEVESTAKEGKQ